MAARAQSSLKAQKIACHKAHISGSASRAALGPGKVRSLRRNAPPISALPLTLPLVAGELRIAAGPLDRTQPAVWAGKDLAAEVQLDAAGLAVHIHRVPPLGANACHPMTPYMAQGAAASIEDGAVLARCLDSFHPVEEAFARYAALRRERTARIQLTSGRNEWLSRRTDPDWVYGYDALVVPVVEGPEHDRRIG